MNTIGIGGDCREVRLLLSAASELRDYSARWAREPRHMDLRVEIDEDAECVPFRVRGDSTVEISTYEAAGLCRYGRVRRGDYLLLCTLLGLTQWKVMQANPLLRTEDLSHPSGSRCLFACPAIPEEFALSLEDFRVCPGCRAFYHCLGADRELLALDGLARLLRARRPSRYRTHEHVETGRF